MWDISLVPMPVNVRQFYLDERRRTSDEATFGLEWTLDADPDARYGLHWIERTKEIYVLRGPTSPLFLRNGSPGGGAIPPSFADDEYEVVVDTSYPGGDPGEAGTVTGGLDLPIGARTTMLLRVRRN